MTLAAHQSSCQIQSPANAIRAALATLGLLFGSSCAGGSGEQETAQANVAFATDSAAEPESLCLDDCGAPAPIEFSAADDDRFQKRAASFAAGTAPEIYFGEEVDYSELSSVVGLTSGAAGETRCSGVLIAPRIVITAQHCLGKVSHAHFGLKIPSNDVVTLSPQPDDRAVATITIDGQPRRLDLALIKLAGPAPSGFAPAAIAAGPLIDAAPAIRIAGFGMTETGSSGKKLKADVIVTSGDCRGVSEDGASDADLFGCIPGQEIVAGGRPGAPIRDSDGADTCRGDSGGGAFATIAAAPNQNAYEREMEEGRYALAAITSRTIQRSRQFAEKQKSAGAPAEAQCGRGGVYVRLDGPVRDWIVRHVQRLGGEATFAGATIAASDQGE